MDLFRFAAGNALAQAAEAQIGALPEYDWTGEADEHGADLWRKRNRARLEREAVSEGRRTTEEDHGEDRTV